MWQFGDGTSGEADQLCRRRFLGASLAGAMGVLAGCADSEDDEDDNGDEDGGGYSLDRSR